MKPLKELLLPDERVVSFVGAGGKTTFIQALARQLSGWGARVLITTTTRMYPPPRNFMLLGSGPVPPYRQLTVGRAVDPGTGKLSGVDPEEIPALKSEFRADYVLVEADGAAGRPVKAPRAHEPVVPECSDLVVGVMGLDCLGRLADAGAVFCLEEFLAVTGMEPGGLIGPQCLDRLVEHPMGLFKGAPQGARRLAFHNKADAFPGHGRVSGSARLGWFLEAGPEIGPETERK